MFGAMINYWYYTGDTAYNKLTSEALLFQIGPNADYMPPNQTLTEGNDDQGFWGLAVMSAAEFRFEEPGGSPGWLALAQAVFNTQAARWDTQHCGGGLRWQIFQFNAGWDYKNSISQACFFQLAARLALYTGNTSYADWAVRTWDWMIASGLMQLDTYFVFDGVHIDNCSDITIWQWTYNAGGFLLGAAAMYNLTSDPVWRARVDGLLDGISVFFVGEQANIMSEVICEEVNLCNVDQQSFKAYLARWLAATMQWAPWTRSVIQPLVSASAVAAARQCTGGPNGRMCGLRWDLPGGAWDGSTGVGQQMAALEVVLANLANDVPPPVTANSGGTSRGDSAAGGSDIGRTDPFAGLYVPTTTADRAGAGILTAILILGISATFVIMCTDIAEPGSATDSRSRPVSGNADHTSKTAPMTTAVPAKLRRASDEASTVFYGAPAFLTNVAAMASTSVADLVALGKRGVLQRRRRVVESGRLWWSASRKAEGDLERHGSYGNDGSQRQTAQEVAKAADEKSAASGAATGERRVHVGVSPVMTVAAAPKHVGEPVA